MPLLALALKNWRLVASVGGAVLLFAGLAAFAAYEHHQGYVDGYSKARQECADEKQKQETANQNAMNAAAKKLAETLKQLELKDVQLDDYLKAVDLAADKEPGASGQCLTADSVRRLGAIQ